MYVLVANGYCGVIKSRAVLDLMTSIYPYPKFRKVEDEAQAFNLLNKFKRSDYSSIFRNYGETVRSGYVDVSYIICDKALYATYDISKAGEIFIMSNWRKGIVSDNGSSMIKVVFKELSLNRESITGNCIAIQNCLDTLGGFVDVNIHVPDISVYLALTKYSGENYVIRELQSTIKNRLGGCSLTIDR